ncbi:MAG: histidine kinase, partial [Actinobacteria bacterium]|nr:histidine kinase [Actinomycetota bacterium]
MAGFVTLLVSEIGWLQGLRTLGVLLLIVGGAAILALPWILRIYRSQAEQRRDLIREQERLDIAVQVHDSVLQTLTLIQANAQDPAQVSRLARTEERRLRTWLYQPEDAGTETVAGAIRATAAQVELDYGAVVDVVSVGDCPRDSRTDPLVAAAAEAIVNAAKHAGPR